MIAVDPNEIVRISENMCESDKCSGEDDSASDDDIISPISEQSMSDTEVIVSDEDTYRNRLDVYICQWYLSKMSNNVLIIFIVCHLM